MHCSRRWTACSGISHKVDEDLLEELEEISISADVGMTATEEILDQLRDRIRDGRLKEKEQVMDALREIMTGMIEKASRCGWKQAQRNPRSSGSTAPEKQPPSAKFHAP